MPDQTTVHVTPPLKTRRRARAEDFGDRLIHVEYLDGSRAHVPMRELETLRKAFRFVEPPGRV